MNNYFSPVNELRLGAALNCMGRSLLLCGLLMCCLTSAYAQVAALDSAHPHDAHYVAPSSAADVQQALVKYGKVRLGPGSYPGTLRLRSGNQVYGVPGTHVHRVEVEPGCKGAVLWRATHNLVFPSGAGISKYNIFVGNGTVYGERFAIDSNIFLDVGGIGLDFSSDGYMRNNRFIRVVLQGKRDVQLRGNERTPSYNNVFLWFNPLCPQISPMQIEDMQDLTFVGVDAELWLSKGTGSMFQTGKMGTLRIFGAQGAENTQAGSRDGHNYQPMPILDTAAEEVQVYGLTPHCSRVDPNFILREGNKRLFMADCKKYTRSIPESNEFDLNVFESKSSGTDVFKQKGVTPEGLKSMLIPENRTGQAWETPQYRELPDPAGEDWKQAVADATDHTEMLQKRIDKEGIVLLEAGTYYISKPLSITYKNSIVGAGMDQTVIIAKDPKMSMFRADARSKPTSVTLANLTLQGAAVGLELREKDIGTFISRSYISHVQFRHMSTAGIYVNMPAGLNVQSLDNNLLSYCIFYRCASGVKQTASTAAPAGFLDKNLFYGCQFIECAYGLELPARRPNNLNSCINTLFRNCGIAAVNMRNSYTTTFANCDFINNAGDPVISSGSKVIIVSSRLQAGRGAKSLLPSRSIVEGSIFEPAGANQCVVVKNGTMSHFYNCSSKLPIGRLGNGMLSNNAFFADKAYSQLVVLVNNGRPETLIPGKSEPSPQMLFGSSLGAQTATVAAAKKTNSEKKSRSKPKAVATRPSKEIVQQYDARLRQALEGALKTGTQVTFHLSSVKSTATVESIDDKGNMQLRIEKPKMKLRFPFDRLGEKDRRTLAQSLARKGEAEANVVAAFYALLTNERKIAQDHLFELGKEAAADVKALFTASVNDKSSAVKDL